MFFFLFCGSITKRVTLYIHWAEGCIEKKINATNTVYTHRCCWVVRTTNVWIIISPKTTKKIRRRSYGCLLPTRANDNSHNCDVYNSTYSKGVSVCLSNRFFERRHFFPVCLFNTFFDGFFCVHCVWLTGTHNSLLEMLNCRTFLHTASSLFAIWCTDEVPHVKTMALQNIHGNCKFNSFHRFYGTKLINEKPLEFRMLSDPTKSFAWKMKWNIQILLVYKLVIASISALNDWWRVSGSFFMIFS